MKKYRKNTSGRRSNRPADVASNRPSKSHTRLSARLSLLEPMEARLLFSTYTVNTLSDAVNPGTGLLSLRQAVLDADSHAGADSINFAASLFTTSGQKTIALTRGEIDFNDTTGATTITGPGASKLAISGQNASRVFEINAKSSVTLSALTVIDGVSSPGTNGDSYGGGIYNAGSLTLNGVTVSNCSANGVTPATFDNTQSNGQGEGGGVYSVGSLTLQNSTITGDSATGASNEDNPETGYGGSADGGGIFSTGTLTLSSSSVSGNTATGGEADAYDGEDTSGGSADGGGIFSSGTLTATALTITGNSALGGAAGSTDTSSGGTASGGGIFAGGSITLANSLVANNTAVGGTAPVGNFPSGASLAYGGAATGGGIFTSAILNVTASTFSGDTAVGGPGAQTFFDGYGGNASGGAIDASGVVSVTNSTFTDNAADGGTVGGDDFGESGGTARGGAIYAGGSTTIQSSSITQNSAEGGNAISWAIGGSADGAGIFTQISTLHLLDSTVANNTAVAGNSADDAGSGSINGGDATGGICAANGTVRLIDSTVAGNAATGGAGSPVGTSTNGGNGGNAVGGIFSGQGMQIYDSTVANNSATGGTGGPLGAYPGTPGKNGTAIGGISNPSTQGLLDNTIVSANKGNDVFSDIGGNIAAASAYNLIGVGGGLTNGVNGNHVGVTNPKLSALGNYGGPTQTLYPLPGSPALAAGSTALIPSGFTTDQRGLPRVVNGKVDIGAVEFSQIVITGNIYNDLNGDGIRETGEPALAGWQVYIDLKNTGSYVVGDPTASTNSLGNYTITFSPITVPGSLIVREVLQNGWRHTQPTSTDYSISSSVGTASNINFGNTRTNLVAGTVFDDKNGNGKQDSGEAGLANWTVEVDSYVNGKWQDDVAHTTTNSSGVYQLILPAGTYRIHDVLKSGLKPTIPASGQISLVLTTGLTDSAENFGNR